jgi:hypothetical protein
MFTLFQIMTLESWGEIARIIWATEDSKFMLFVVLFFIGISSFAIMNTVMAVIVEHTLGEAMDQKADLIRKAEEELQKLTEDLMEIFLAADADGGGTLCKEEFVSALDSPETRKLLQKMDLGDDIGSLDPEEIGMLFDTIDIDHNTELSPQEFVNGMMQMRGAARARRIFELQCAVLKMQKNHRKELNIIHTTVKQYAGKEPSEGNSPSSPRKEPIDISYPEVMTELEAKIELGLTKQKQAVVDLEAKFDSGMSHVNSQLSNLMRLLPRPAA